MNRHIWVDARGVFLTLLLLFQLGSITAVGAQGKQTEVKKTEVKKTAEAKQTEAIASKPPQEELIDAIVASVNGKPITLQDLISRLTPRRALTLSQAASDPQSKLVLDTLIREQLIQAEADALRISVNAEDLDRYVDEVAKLNNLTVQQFTDALVAEGRSIEEYKHFVRFEMLRSRIANSQIRSAVVVSDEEVETFLASNPAVLRDGPRIRLSRIVIGTVGRSSEEAQARLEAVQAALQSDEEFAEVASQFSDTANNEPGGSIGIVVERDLSPQIFDAIFELPDGGISTPIEIANSYQIFKVHERISAGENNEKLRQEVRTMLLSQKMDGAVHAYFENELFKRYSIDRKI